MGPHSNEAIDIRIEESDLPILSGVATRLFRLVESERGTVREIEKLVRLDPSLALRILRLANSPIYGGLVKIGTIEQAVVRLGMDELRRVTLMAATGEVFADNDPYIKGFWQHSIAVAIIAHQLSNRLGIGEPEECFVAGLVHDVGKVIIYRQVADVYGELVDQAALQERRFYLHERMKLNYCSHETVGALVGRKWDLTPSTIEVIRFHHDIEEKEEMSRNANPATALVSVANLLANILGHGTEAPSTINVLESFPAQALDIPPNLIEEFHKTLPEIIDEQRRCFR